MAEGPGEQSQSLFRPPMSDPEVDLERWRGARPKVAEPQTAQTKKEEAKAAPTEEHVTPVAGVQIFIYHWEANPGFQKESPGGPPL